MHRPEGSASRGHVVILNWRDPWHPEGGGSELYVEQIAQRLCGMGHDVTIFSAAFPGAHRVERVGKIRHIRRGGHLTVYLWAAYLLVLGRLGPLGRTDQVLEVQNGMPFLARLFTRARVVVLLHHVHREQWPVVGPMLARVGWFMESRVAVRVNRGLRYIAVSDVTRVELVDLGVNPRSISVAYNGVPPMPHGVSAAPRQNPHLVVLSRLVPHKRIEHAIRAVAALRTEVPDLGLTVMGSGWWQGELEELRDRLELADAVEFLGHVDERRKYQELSRAWVHLLPSVKEGWGLSIVEAARVGVPSVAYRDAGGVRESIVDGVTGLLADDEEHFVHCLRTLLAHHGLRTKLGRAALLRTEKFTWEAAATAVERALLDLPARATTVVADAA